MAEQYLLHKLTRIAHEIMLDSCCNACRLGLHLYIIIICDPPHAIEGKDTAVH